jgi:hypothetical protein
MEDNVLNEAGTVFDFQFLYNSLELMRSSMRDFSLEDFVLRTIEELMEINRRAYLEILRMDNGPEFISKRLRESHSCNNFTI